jgi:hypothetical protein
MPQSQHLSLPGMALTVAWSAGVICTMVWLLLLCMRRCFQPVDATLLTYCYCVGRRRARADQRNKWNRRWPPLSLDSRQNILTPLLSILCSLCNFRICSPLQQSSQKFNPPGGHLYGNTQNTKAKQHQQSAIHSKLTTQQ